MPDAKNIHVVVLIHLIDDDVGPNDDQLPCPSNQTAAPSAGKQGKAVSGQDEFPRHPTRGDGIFLREVAHNAHQIGARPTAR